MYNIGDFDEREDFIFGGVFDESVDLIIFEGDFEDIEDYFILGSLNDSSFEFELVGSISAFIFSI